jgi:methylenetetrahydrofolate dehydrogenase (NADP+)/methenyltetrahydrofolate cyclohydrolase
MEKIDGKEVSALIDQQVQEEIEKIKTKINNVPGLTVIIVGENPASKIYVRTKHKKAAKLGVRSEVLEYDKSTSAEILIQKIKELNQDDNVHGILVQLPLPDPLEAWEILDHLDPGKDADRIHPFNLGMVLLNRAEIFPCTPAGIFKLLEHYKIDVFGMNAVVVGRSYIVSKPLANMLTNRHATVSICHTKTRDLREYLQNADIVVAAAGKAGLITADMVKKDSILIDVGMNYLDKEADVLQYCNESQIEKFAKKGYGITGDIHPDAFLKSSYYTPVPGGVGRMTVSMLMKNTLQLFKTKYNI